MPPWSASALSAAVANCRGQQPTTNPDDPSQDINGPVCPHNNSKSVNYPTDLPGSGNIRCGEIQSQNIPLPVLAPCSSQRTKLLTRPAISQGVTGVSSTRRAALDLETRAAERGIFNTLVRRQSAEASRILSKPAESLDHNEILGRHTKARAGKMASATDCK